MTMFSTLTFDYPYVLAGLLLLPAIWRWLQINPPPPSVIPFPPFSLLKAAESKPPQPYRLPLWLLILRLLLLATLIVAMADPAIVPNKEMVPTSGPLLLVVDDDWTTAMDWPSRQSSIERILDEAERHQQPVSLLVPGNRITSDLSSPSSALEQWRHAIPQAYTEDRSILLAPIRQFLNDHPDGEIVYVTSGVSGSEDADFTSRLEEILNNKRLTLYVGEQPDAVAITNVSNGTDGLTARLVYSGTHSQNIKLVAYDRKARKIAEATAPIVQGEPFATAAFAIPTELRNEIYRIETEGQRSAGAVHLLDSHNKRHRVGLASGTPTDISQPLLSPVWYITQALSPYADLIEGKGGINEAIETLINSNPSALILSDVGGLTKEAEARLADFIRSGHTVLRFAGPRMTAPYDTLIPVHIRSADRSLGGTLAWDTPKTLAPFKKESPFDGMDVASEITVSRQLLAEPDAELSQKTWAALSDGTPIVTAERRGKGLLILFHITADTRWSNLPLSGTFVGMLRRILSVTQDMGQSTEVASPSYAAPYRIMDGYGALGEPSATDKAIEIASMSHADLEHKAGLYGDAENPVAVNVMSEKDKLVPLVFNTATISRVTLSEQHRISFGPILLILAAIIFAIETFGTFLLRHRINMPSLKSRYAGTGLMLLACSFCLSLPDNGLASPLAPKDAEGPLQTHFAYVVTGDSTIDRISFEGLSSLSQFLSQHTALEPGEPVGVELSIDDLAVYPLLYWPIAAGRPLPDAAGLAKVDAFMRDGGTVLFDTRDAPFLLTGRDTTPETKALRTLLSNLSVPALEPVPQDHVLTKAFYLIKDFPGRYAEGKTWIEALPPSTADGDQPVRSGDGVSPILITSNDLASAWASSRRGEPLYPINQTIPRQREMSLRAGANIAMYVLTGNYKADQVHVPALLERLEH